MTDGEISIHAPRVRCDVLVWDEGGKLKNISIHAPRVRCDTLLSMLFLHFFYFNPRTSCEVRPILFLHVLYFKNISIHAPRVRCDLLSK